MFFEEFFFAIFLVLGGKELSSPFLPVIMVIFKLDFLFLKRFCKPKANSTEAAPPPIKAILLFFFISVKKLLDNFEIGLTGTQYLSAPFIVLLLLCMPVFIDSTSNFIFGLFLK